MWIFPKTLLNLQWLEESSSGIGPGSWVQGKTRFHFCILLPIFIELDLSPSQAILWNFLYYFRFCPLVRSRDFSYFLFGSNVRERIYTRTGWVRVLWPFFLYQEWNKILFSALLLFLDKTQSNELHCFRWKFTLNDYSVKLAENYIVARIHVSSFFQIYSLDNLAQDGHYVLYVTLICHVHISYNVRKSEIYCSIHYLDFSSLALLWIVDNLLCWYWATFFACCCVTVWRISSLLESVASFNFLRRACQCPCQRRLQRKANRIYCLSDSFLHVPPRCSHLGRLEPELSDVLQ